MINELCGDLVVRFHFSPCCLSMFNLFIHVRYFFLTDSCKNHYVPFRPKCVLFAEYLTLFFHHINHHISFEGRGGSTRSMQFSIHLVVNLKKLTRENVAIYYLNWTELIQTLLQRRPTLNLWLDLLHASSFYCSFS